MNSRPGRDAVHDPNPAEDDYDDDMAAADAQVSAFHAGRAAMAHSLAFDDQSRLVRNNNSQGKDQWKPCEVKWGDVELGEFLGSGAFSDVREGTLVRCSCSEHTNECERNCGKKYAIKYLKESVIRKRKTFEEGAVDLMNEAKLLTHLRHDNIVGLRGITHGCPSKSYLNDSCFFLVLDLLENTLEDLLKTWKFQDRRLGKSSNNPFLKKLLKKKTALTNEQKSRRADRLVDIGLPVADAMEFLHKHRVIFRDLKPSNVGFHASGKLVLFDLGLAREIVDDGRRLTGKTGSARYMAPEVANYEHYGLSADVYSYGIFLWEVLTMEKPFAGMNFLEFHDLVANAGVRPRVDSKCGSRALQKLIQQCWDSCPDVRPNFLQIKKIIVTELAADDSYRDRGLDRSARHR